jgi:3-hydroxyisobutyrate dehydrogenase-like beta-hydroxyacid dehydrogenase
MGSAVGRRLRETGARVISVVEGRSPASVERVRRAGVEIVSNEEMLADEASFILSIVPPGVAVNVAERMRAPLAHIRHQPIFADCNAVSPATACKIDALLKPTACRFVDAGIIGGPPPAGVVDAAQGPRFYASGVHAHALRECLEGHHLDIVVLDAPVGAASALKLSYAGLTKGITALGAAMISAAARDGLAEVLSEELARSQPDLLKRLRRSIPAMFPKAYRWIAEMEQIAEFAGDKDGSGDIYRGAARLYEHLAAELEKDDTGEVIRVLKDFCEG